MSEESAAPANAIICGQCKTWYTGIATAHCGGCHLTFSRVSSFDRHRVGGKCKSPAVAGLVRNGRTFECYGMPGGDSVTGVWDSRKSG